jgi:hypothetical protein
MEKKTDELTKCWNALERSNHGIRTMKASKRGKDF